MTGWGHRNHPAWWAFAVHRLSGLALAIFMPLHVLVLALAVDAERFDALLVWTDRLPVRLAEAGMVGLLAVHLAGGLRLLALELLPPSGRSPLPRIVAALAAGPMAALAFLWFAA
jgi:fumarate reductase subunit D